MATMQTVVRNTGVGRYIGYVTPHGKQLAHDETVVIDGLLEDQLISTNRTKLNAFLADALADRIETTYRIGLLESPGQLLVGQDSAPAVPGDDRGLLWVKNPGASSSSSSSSSGVSEATTLWFTDSLGVSHPLTGGGGSVAGSDKQVQFNDGGVLGADPGFTYNKATGKLTIAGILDPTAIIIDERPSVPGGTPPAGKVTIWAQAGGAGLRVVTDAGEEAAILTTPVQGSSSSSETPACTSIYGCLTLNGNTYDTFLCLTNGKDVAVSETSTGRIIYNATTQKFQASENGGAYVDMVGGSSGSSTAPTPPGGNDTEVQFNDGGAFGGSSNLVFVKATPALTLRGTFVLNGTDALTYMSLSDGKSAAASDTNTGRIMYNATAQKFQVSENGGAYVDMVGGSSSSSCAPTPPGGNDTEVQFNDGGAFGGNAGFTFNKTTGKLTVAGLLDPTGLVLTGQASVPGGSPGEDKGTLWVKSLGSSSSSSSSSSAGETTTLWFTDSLGVDHELGAGGGGGTPGGNDTEIQYNNGGAFAGCADLKYTSSTLQICTGLKIKASSAPATWTNAGGAGTDVYMKTQSAGTGDTNGASLVLLMGGKSGAGYNGSFTVRHINASYDATFIGDMAGCHCTGARNTFLGYQAGFQFTTGEDNVCVGASAGQQSTGSCVVAVGSYALSVANANLYNTAIGYYALNISTGERNTVVGGNAMSSLTSGEKNCAFGQGVGNALETGSQNILMGYQANTIANNSTNAVAIGVQSAASSYCVCIGSSTTCSQTGSIILGTYASGVTAGIMVCGSNSYPINTLYGGKGEKNNTPSAWAVSGTCSSANGTAGGNLILAGGLANQAADAGGSVIIQTAAAAAGTTLTTRLTAQPDGVILLGALSAPPAAIQGGMYYGADNKFYFCKVTGSGWKEVTTA